MGFKMEKCLVYENKKGFLKNHWTKHSHVCTHSDVISILIANMDAVLNNSVIFEHFLEFSNNFWKYVV